MFNQEQLAAIAAAVSILQQSMQSNPTNNTSQTASSASTVTTSSSTNNGTNHQLAAIQQQLAEAAAAAVAASQVQTHLNQNPHQQHHLHHQQQQQHQQQQHQHQQLSDVDFDHLQRQQNHLNGLSSMASLKAALPMDSDHHLHRLPTRHSTSVASSAHAPTNTPNTSTSQQDPLLSQLGLHYNRPDLNSVSQASQSHYPAQLQLDEQQQQILLNHLRVLQQPAQESHHLTNVLPELTQQQQQQQHQSEHQGLFDQYQTKLRDLQQLSNLHLSAQLSPNRPQASMAQMDQRQQHPQQQQSKAEIDQKPPAIITQVPAPVKSSRPISYSAIVAKSAGLASSSSNTMNQNAPISAATSVSNENSSSGTNNVNPVSQSKLRNLAATHNAYGDGLDHVNNTSNPTSPFSVTANNHPIGNHDSINKFANTNGTSSINGHGSRTTAQQQQQHLVTSNSIVRHALNNHVANSTGIDIFSTNDLTGSSLAHTNGSSLLKQRNSNNLLSLEPSLDGYHSDYPISPAQQLFSQQNNSFRHNQVSAPTYNHHQAQNNNHSSFNTDIIFNTNSRDKGTPTYGRATNLLGFMGLYVGNLSPDLSKEQLERMFSKYGEPVKAHRLIRSPVAFIKYENTESPRSAIDDLYGLLLPGLTLNLDQPLKLHFDRNDAQLKANYRPTELPKEDNGECYGWRTTVCKRGKSCPKKHIPINRGIDFQMWMIKSSSTSTTTTGATTSALSSSLTS